MTEIYVARECGSITHYQMNGELNLIMDALFDKHPQTAKAWQRRAEDWQRRAEDYQQNDQKWRTWALAEVEYYRQKLKMRCEQ